MADMFNLDQFKDAKFYKQGFNEFMGTMLWVMLSMNDKAAGNAFAMGITYIVIKHAMSCFDSEGLHMFTPYTMYKMFENKNLDPLKGLVWIILQILGAYVGGLLGNALGMTFPQANTMDAWKWDAGFQYFFGLMMLLHVFIYCRNNSDSSDIPVSLMMVFGFAVTHWFMPEHTNLNWTSYFSASHLPDHIFNKNMWIDFVWSLIVVIVAWVKFAFIMPAVQKE